MSLNPLNALKRRLEDSTAALPKRLCLAKNVVKSHHFPTAPKERLVAEWLQSLMEKNSLSGEDLRNVISWLNVVDDLTSDLKTELIQIVSQYIQRNTLKSEDIESIVAFLGNPKMSTQLNILIDDYLLITITLLQYFRNEDTSNALQKIVFNNLIRYYKDCKKKLEFIVKLLQGENLETIFSYLNSENRNCAISLCENILFPISRKSYFINFLQTLIRKDNIDELINEKGDNIQCVLKIMDAFFAFPKGRCSEDPKFLKDYIDVFVSCFRKESQLIFAFYIMVANTLNMEQNYLKPAMTLNTIVFDENDEKIKRNLFLNMLEVILHNEVDINTRLTDTFGEKISKVEIKKTSLLFLQAVMMGQLKLEGKPDKTTLQIVKTALKLDPILIEQKMEDILPPLMVMKKNSSTIMEFYIETLNCLLETLFKLSRGVTFISQILPNVKNCLEASNTVQFELKQKLIECEQNHEDYNKIRSKIITGNDVFPKECMELYGKLTSELMFRQNKELLVSLQKDFELHCLLMLEEGFVSPSIITLAEILAAILSCFLQHNKMADHTVPQNIAEEFWSTFQNFEQECLKKFGECILKLNYNPPLMQSFLNLCVSYSQLKLLNINYSNYKLALSNIDTSDVFDMSALLPCLTSKQWIALVSRIEDDEARIHLDKLILNKTIVLQTLINDNEKSDEAIASAKSYLIKQLTKNEYPLETNTVSKVIFSELDRNQLKQLSKYLIKSSLNDTGNEIFRNDVFSNNKELLNALVVETCKTILNNIDNTEALAKSLKKQDTDIGSFAKDIDMKAYFNQISHNGDDTILFNCVDILKQLQICYLEEKYQLLAVFVLLVLKKCGQKKLRRNSDYVLRSIFELSAQTPDLYKIFPIEYIFSFEDKVILNLLTLKIKSSNSFLIIKSLIESAVKRVRIESDLVKTIVKLILKKRKDRDITSIENFVDPAFQMCCIILPLIVKQKRAITASAYRSILADLQEKLHMSLLESFKNINFNETSNLLNTSTDNTDESMVVSENTMATLNAMAAYSITLSKYCETTDAEEIKNLDCLWSGLEYFVQTAIKSIQSQESKTQHVESSIQLLNVVLRHLKKLESHYIFETRDKLFLQIWRSIKSRLFMIHENKHIHANNGCLEDIAVTLKFLCELSSVECFVKDFVGELNSLTILEKLPQKPKEAELTALLTTRHVCKYLWANCLKANIVGPKCIAMTKIMYSACKTAKGCIWQHYEAEQYGVTVRTKKKKVSIDVQDEDVELKVLKLEDSTCEVLKLFLDTLSEAIMSAKKISLDYKFLDSIFELQHLIQFIVGCNALRIRCEVSWQAFFRLFEGSISVLNGLLVSREELLEDRWPCFMQCYRTLVRCLCERASSQEQFERAIQEKLAETAHSVEKLTQSISKRKAHVSRIAAYTVADICSVIEKTAPPRQLRQHLENSVSYLIQVSDTNYSVAFLRRALAGHPGQMTMTNLYTMYKRYHKYVGNA